MLRMSATELCHDVSFRSNVSCPAGGGQRLGQGQSSFYNARPMMQPARHVPASRATSSLWSRRRKQSPASRRPPASGPSPRIGRSTCLGGDVGVDHRGQRLGRQTPRQIDGRHLAGLHQPSVATRPSGRRSPAPAGQEISGTFAETNRAGGRPRCRSPPSQAQVKELADVRFAADAASQLAVNSGRLDDGADAGKIVQPALPAPSRSTRWRCSAPRETQCRAMRRGLR